MIEDKSTYKSKAEEASSIDINSVANENHYLYIKAKIT